MRNPRLHRWSNLDDTLGLLIFAQRLEELLFDYTLDSYKTPALNTYTRCVELLGTIDDVQSGLIRPKSIKPIVEELADSVASDPAAKALVAPHALDFCRPGWWAVEKPPQLKTQAQMLRSRLWKRAYEKELGTQLRAAIAEAKQKELITHLTASLAVEWMRQGFSRDFIFMKTRVFFFGFGGDPIDSLDAFDAFIALFESRDQSFAVCLRTHLSVLSLAPAVPKELATLQPHAPAARTGTKREAEFLDAPHDGGYAVFPEIKAHDASAARDHALRIMANLSTAAAYHVHRTPFAVDAASLVWQGDRAIVLRGPRLPLHKHDECSLADLPARFAATLTALTPRRGGQDAWERIRAALALHASAVSSQDIPVQLTMLWSALEAIVPSALEEARIDTICDVLGPVLSRGYARKLFSDLDATLSRCVPKVYKEARAVVGAPEGGAETCALIVAMNGKSSARDLLFEATGRNPLLRFRIFSLQKAFRHGEATLETIQAHERRVRWHLRRIYRTRNMIVHAGRSVRVREALVENAHAYLHHVINLLEELYSISPFPADLDAAFLTMRMQHERHLWWLKEHEEVDCDKENVQLMLFGDGLPN